MSIAELKRKAWDDALLLTLCENTEGVDAPGIDGEKLLPIIIREATDAVARLKEVGTLVGDEEEL